MRSFRIRQTYNRGGSSQAITDVSVLIRISDVYSDSLVSFQILVDPWPFFAFDELKISGGWLLEAQSQETADLGGMGRRKRRKTSTPLYAPWAPTSLPASPRQRHHSSDQPSILNGGSDAQLYKYKPLRPRSMRLLHLLPADNKDQILQGVLVHIPHGVHASGGTYRALSYVWGTNDRTKELMTPDGVIRITPSLSVALRHIRKRTVPLVLWVDAVCINQSDNTEKAEQIRLLPTIFQNAELTLAFWAGSDMSGPNDAAVEMLRRVQAKMRLQDLEAKRDLGSDSGVSEDEDSTLEEVELLAGIPLSWKGENIPLPNDPVWRCIESLFSLPWFRRAWILQEVVVSADLWVVCGDSLINWSQLQLAVEVVHREAQASEHETMVRIRATLQPFMALATQREWEARHSRWALLSLLEHFRQAESTLRRDRFFALLGMASDANEPEFKPDYDSPLEVIVVRLARAFVRQGRGMQLLYRAGLNAHSHRFPSWVPDWTIPRPDCLHESDQRAVPFDASRSQEACILVSADTNDLRVGGYMVDVVEHVSAASNTEGEWKEYLTEVDTMIDEASLAVVSDDRDELKWKVPIAGVEHPKFTACESVNLKTSYEMLRELLKRDADIGVNGDGGSGPLGAHSAHPVLVGTSRLRKQSASYASVLRDTVAGWRFVSTKRVYVGVAPGLVKAADTIVIMKGGLVPFVLRESEERQGIFRLVGECYVHGIMHGEGLALDNVAGREFCLH